MAGQDPQGKIFGLVLGLGLEKNIKYLL